MGWLVPRSLRMKSGNIIGSFLTNWRKHLDFYCKSCTWFYSGYFWFEEYELQTKAQIGALEHALNGCLHIYCMADHHCSRALSSNFSVNKKWKIIQTISKREYPQSVYIISKLTLLNSVSFFFLFILCYESFASD